MKNKLLLLGIALLAVTAVGCSKQKTCRCAVPGTSKVRIFKIEKGECEQLHVLQYHTELDSLKVDSLLCTDYEFAIDSIYNE